MPELELPKTYWGARFTADAADCDLPITIDNRSGCTYNCLYCFANSLMRDETKNVKKSCQLKRLKAVQTEFSTALCKKLLKGQLNNKTSNAMKPYITQGNVIQMGGLGDVFDELEPKTRWALEMLQFYKDSKIPVRISTKGARTILRKEYMDIFEGMTNLWVAFSIITSDDEMSKRIDMGAPLTSERFKAMKELSDRGVRTSLRYRPIIRPLAMREHDGKPEYQILVDNAVKAGASAISYETMFLNQSANDRQVKLYRMMSDAIDEKNFFGKFKYNSIRNQTCLRENRYIKYNLMLSIRNYAKNNGLIVGISDPHFKEYGDYGCCCGVSRKDSIFGKHGTSMTDIVIMGRKHYEKTGENLRFSFDDWPPNWSKNINIVQMCNNGDKFKKMCEKKVTWNDKLRNSWNNPNHKRSPYNYFEGILHPVELDNNNDMIYEYRHWAGQIFKDYELPKIDVSLDDSLKEKCMEQDLNISELRSIASKI